MFRLNGFQFLNKAHKTSDQLTLTGLTLIQTKNWRTLKERKLKRIILKMIISVYTTALLLLLAVPFSDAKYGGDCYFDSVGYQLSPQSKGESCIERGEGICSEEWGFGLTKSGKLRLYKEDNQVWDSGEHKIDFCNVNEDGAFACYKGSCFNPKGKAIYAVNCGDCDESYMEIDANNWDVVNKKGGKKSWAITKGGDEVDTCASDDNCHFDSVGSTLKPVAKKGKSCIELGEGICSGKWGFGLTDDGELRLYRGSTAVWEGADDDDIGFCNMNMDGTFACYEGNCFNPSSKALYALKCGGKAGSYMKIDEKKGKVLKRMKDEKSWALEKNGNEVGSC